VELSTRGAWRWRWSLRQEELGGGEYELAGGAFAKRSLQMKSLRQEERSLSK